MKELAALGHDVIDLGVGERDFDTPAHIIEAAYAAARAGDTRYTPTVGAQDLRQAIVNKLTRENNLRYSTDEVIVSNGAKQVIYDALMVTMEPGEEVLLCAPYFDIYNTMTHVFGGTPKVITCGAQDSFQLTPQALEDAISLATRWLFLNPPSHPAGAVYTADVLRALGEVLSRHPRVQILADEIYEHIIFDGREFVSFAAACPELRDRTLCVNGVSKSYAMTGWRIGYGAGPQALIAAMTKVQSQITSGASSISQAAALAALTGPQDNVSQFKEAFERRRNIVLDGIAQCPDLTLEPPGGAFYTFIGCGAFIGARAPDGSHIDDDVGFCQYWLNEGLVAAIPGSAYGLSPFFRLSTAASDDELSKATQRIVSCVATLTRVD